MGKLKNNTIMKKFVKGAALASIIAMTFAGTSCAKINKDKPVEKEPETIVQYQESVPLPSKETASKNLENLLGSNYGSYMLRDKTLVRLPCPENGESIKVNIDCQLSNETLELIKFSFDEYNKIFEVINPNYKFEMNYNPTEQDLKNPYNIDIRVTDAFEENEKGIAHAAGDIYNYSGAVDGYETYNNVITIRRDCLNYGQALMGAVKHEIGHLFGRGDAYNNDNVTNQTIMSGGLLFNGSLICTPYSSLKNTDVGILDGVYRDPYNKLPDDYIKNFVKNYEKTNEFSYEHFTAAKDFGKYQEEILNMDFNVLIDSIKKSEYDQSVKDGLINTLNTIPVIDTSFGKLDVKIGECKKDSDRYTYYQWNGNDLQKESPGSWMTTTIIKKGGIVRVGNEYWGTVMIRVGDYVLSFEYEKDFKSGNISVSDKVSNIFQFTDLPYYEYVQSMKQNQSEYSIEK